MLAVQFALCTPAAQSSRYSAAETRGIVHLRDADADTTVSLLPEVECDVRDAREGAQRPELHRRAPEQFKGGLTGIPFIGPWANRLDEQAFYANGKQYAFDMEFGNVRGAIPIHGFLTHAQSPVAGGGGEGRRSAAWVTSRLEFYETRSG